MHLIHIQRLARLALLIPLCAGLTAGTPLSPASNLTTPDHPTYSADFVRNDVPACWEWPRGLPLRISASYLAPATPYAAGHRGIDLSAAPGTEVLAPSDGTVSFAGVVVDRPVIAIDHAGDLRSSFEPVEATVAVGDRVIAGQKIGTVTAGGHCDQACFHFGVRLHGQYLSPLMLLGGVPRAVLLPRDLN
jgi:murein DD-endopeptidase MepM/ murein hydrolase activator NlpD